MPNFLFVLVCLWTRSLCRGLPTANRRSKLLSHLLGQLMRVYAFSAVERHEETMQRQKPKEVKSKVKSPFEFDATFTFCIPDWRACAPASTFLRIGCRVSTVNPASLEFHRVNRTSSHDEMRACGSVTREGEEDNHRRTCISCSGLW